MKKFLGLFCMAAFLMVFTGAAFAEGTVKRNYGNCGLGTKWFGDKSSLFAHCTAGYTNGTTGIYGVTTGTMGCEQFVGIVFNAKANNFVASNMDNLANDIAKGNGEYLDTLADLLEVKDTSRSNFYSTLQTNFSKIYTSADVTSDEVVKNISKFM